MLGEGSDHQGFALFNNEQEAKNFFLKFEFIDIRQVYELGIILPSEMEDTDNYTEFKDNVKHLQLKSADVFSLDPDIWYNYPLICYICYDNGFERSGPYEMRLFDITSLNELKNDE